MNRQLAHCGPGVHVPPVRPSRPRRGRFRRVLAQRAWGLTVLCIRSARSRRLHLRGTRLRSKVPRHEPPARPSAPACTFRQFARRDATRMNSRVLSMFGATVLRASTAAPCVVECRPRTAGTAGHAVRRVLVCANAERGNARHLSALGHEASSVPTLHVNVASLPMRLAVDGMVLFRTRREEREGPRWLENLQRPCV
jgi:hypothetical protein